MTVTRAALYAKALDEFELHLFRMNKDMVGKPILDSQGNPVEERVFGIPLVCIHIVRREDDSLPQEYVVEHKERSIQSLKFVVP